MLGIVLVFFGNMPFEIWKLNVAEFFLYFATVMSIVSMIFMLILGSPIFEGLPAVYTPLLILVAAIAAIGICPFIRRK